MKHSLTIKLKRETWEAIEKWLSIAALFPPTREHMHLLHTAIIEELKK